MSNIDRFQKAADKARAEMIRAVEHYATAMQCLALAIERAERAQEHAAWRTRDEDY